MKYIRTNEGFITLPYNEMEWEKLSQEQTGGLSYEKWFEIATSELKIIAQADTLKELIDEFVVVFEDKNHIVYSEFKWAMDKAMWSGMPFIIYGAIWTSKGLIYVAKMNEKGELELI